MDADAMRRQLAAAIYRVAAGDQAALRLVYAETSAKLFGVCLRILNDRSEAEDVLQEVYLTVWRKAAAFDEAVVLYAQVTTLDETNSGAHLNLGLLLYSLGRGTQAARQLARAVELDPGLIGRATAMQPAEPQTPDPTAQADGD